MRRWFNGTGSHPGAGIPARAEENRMSAFRLAIAAIARHWGHVGDLTKVLPR